MRYYCHRRTPVRRLDDKQRRRAKASLERLLLALAHLHPEPGRKSERRRGSEVLAHLLDAPEATVRRWWAGEGPLPLGRAARCARIGRQVGLDITKEDLAPDLAD